MEVDFSTFSQMPDDARTWVYQSSRNFTDAEVDQILQQGKQFLDTWDYHGAPLKAVWEVLYNRFIVLMVDEKTASPGGCSIDKSVALLKSMEQQFNVELLERLNLAYLSSEGEINAVHINKLSEKFAEGVVAEDTTVFNNMITTYAELKNNWQIPLAKSWAGNRVKVL